MNQFKLLIDTNVVIGLEDAQPVRTGLAELVRLSGEHGIGLFVDSANYDDVERDKDSTRRTVTLSKLDKFQRLRKVPLPDEAALIARFGPISGANDASDVRLLASIDAHAADFLVTQDRGLHRRAERVGLDARILTVEEAINWLRQSFTAKSVSLPFVIERKAYEIDRGHPIFHGLRSDYPGFDSWFDKCRRQHRDCWVLEIGSEIAGLVIRKTETRSEANTETNGNRVLKICTFKVRDEFQGEKFGELLLKQVLWFAYRNKYDTAYVTAFQKQAFLIDLLSYYGFEKTKALPNGEIMLEKAFAHGDLPQLVGTPFDFDRKQYPRFFDGAAVRKFCVPILPDYHRRLFPEIAFATELPLFPTDAFGPMLAHGQALNRTPGNTIRKVYLCRAKTTRLRSGDLLFFYMSKDERFSYSQSITTIGIVEQVGDVRDAEELIKQTAKRSVFTADELRAMAPSSSTPVKMIDFLLVGHSEPAVALAALVHTGVFSGRPPQSIAELPEERYQQLKILLRVS